MVELSPEEKQENRGRGKRVRDVLQNYAYKRGLVHDKSERRFRENLRAIVQYFSADLRHFCDHYEIDIREFVDAGEEYYNPKIDPPCSQTADQKQQAADGAAAPVEAPEPAQVDYEQEMDRITAEIVAIFRKK